MLLLVGFNDDEGRPNTPVPLEIVEAVQAAARATDIVGWLHEPVLIGAILSDADVSTGSIEARLRRDLASRLAKGTLKRLSITFHTYPERAPAAGLAWAVDRTLYPDLYPRESERPRYDDDLKRVLDLVLSLGLLVSLSPVLLLTAIVVKLGSPGPVLFRQVRIGQMARPFTMLKFRTMCVGADEGVHRNYVSSFIRGHQPADGSSGPELFKLTNDQRITRVGRVLRKTSLDELPQLWNVVRGEMSLVGPRPALPYELGEYEPWHRCRILEAKPGITGLWQVTGRSRTTFDEMVRLDLRYVRTRSLWTDLKILLATPAAVLSGKGAC